MTNLRKICCIFLVISLLTTFIVGFGKANTDSFTVKQGEEIIHPISLIAEDRVSIQLKVIGENFGASGGRIQFSITFPNATVRNFGGVGDVSTSYVCDVDGDCLLNFTNTDQAEGKLVTLNYEVTHYIFGMPQTLFLVLLIGVVSVLGVAVFIGLSRKPY